MTLLPSCREVQTQLTDYAEGTLPLPHRIGIWIHLLFCRVCAGFLRGLRALPGFVKRSLAPPEAAPEEASRALMEVQALLKRPRP